jgi:DNA-binding HxlR family transcriptional regulator
MAKQQAHSCGLGPALNVVRGKWKGTILWALHERPLRFGELRRRVARISEKILYEHLREMEADGVVQRAVVSAKPAHVEYSLTEPGGKLNAAVHALAEWGTAYAIDRTTTRLAAE